MIIGGALQSICNPVTVPLAGVINALNVAVTVNTNSVRRLTRSVHTPPVPQRQVLVKRTPSLLWGLEAFYDNFSRLCRLATTDCAGPSATSSVSVEGPGAFLLGDREVGLVRGGQKAVLD